MSSSNFSRSPTDRNPEENTFNSFTDECLVSQNAPSSAEVNVLVASPSGTVGFFDAFGPSSIFHPQPTHLLPNGNLPDGAIPSLHNSANPSQNRAPWRVDSSNKLNQWPNRLFTITPPTPALSQPPALPGLQLPLGQQDLANLQDPLQDLPLFTLSPPSSTAQSVLTHRNYQIFQDCRGNREESKEAIFQEIYRLQLEYGELSLTVTEAGRKGPQYKCGVCNHPRTVRPLRTKNKTQRRWDLSPHILRHFSKKIKPWYCECGKAFARSHDRKRHSIACKQSEDFVKPQTPVSSSSDDLVSESDGTHVDDTPLPENVKCTELYYNEAHFSPFPPTANQPYPTYGPQHSLPAFVPFAPPHFANSAIQPFSPARGHSQLGLHGVPPTFNQNLNGWNNNNTTAIRYVQPQGVPYNPPNRPRVVSQDETGLPVYYTQGTNLIGIPYEVPSQTRQLYHSTSAPQLHGRAPVQLPQGRVLDTNNNQNDHNHSHSDRNGKAGSDKVRICTDMLDFCEKQDGSTMLLSVDEAPHGARRTGLGWARVSNQTTHRLKFMMTVSVLILLVLSVLVVFVRQFLPYR